MSAHFDLVTIDAPDPSAAAAFWIGALGLSEVENEDGGRWIVLADQDGARRIGIQRGPAVPGSVHLDLACDADEFDDELRRLVNLGATEVMAARREPYGSIANLLDPDGNAFDLCAYR